MVNLFLRIVTHWKQKVVAAARNFQRTPKHPVGLWEHWFVTRYTHTFNGPFSRTTQVSRYQKGKTNLDFTEARDSEWQWHQLEHMQVCTSLQRDNHANTPPLSFLQAGCRMPFLPPNQQRQSTEGSKIIIIIIITATTVSDLHSAIRS